MAIIIIQKDLVRMCVVNVTGKTTTYVSPVLQQFKQYFNAF